MEAEAWSLGNSGSARACLVEKQKSLAGNCHLFHIDVPLVVIFAQANRASSRTAIPITAKHGRSITKNRVSETGLLEMSETDLTNSTTCISVPWRYQLPVPCKPPLVPPAGDGACSSLAGSSLSCCLLLGAPAELRPSGAPVSTLALGLSRGKLAHAEH